MMLRTPLAMESTRLNSVPTLPWRSNAIACNRQRLKNAEDCIVLRAGWYKKSTTAYERSSSTRDSFQLLGSARRLEDIPDHCESRESPPVKDRSCDFSDVCMSLYRGMRERTKTKRQGINNLVSLEIKGDVFYLSRRRVTHARPTCEVPATDLVKHPLHHEIEEEKARRKICETKV